MQRATSAMLILAVLASVALGLTPAAAALPERDAAARAVQWLQSQQLPDGSFPGFGITSTADVVYAIAASGGDPAKYVKDGKTPLDYLRARAREASATAGGAAKFALAAVAGGQNPSSFGGTDLVAATLAHLDPQSGQFGKDVFGHAFAMLALKSAGKAIPAQSIVFLRSKQTARGSWSFSGDTSETAGDTNTTAVVVQAMVAAGEPAPSATIQKALQYFKSIQNDDGGWPFQNPSLYGTATDANSTALVVQALLAAGENPEVSAWTKSGVSPVKALLGLQNRSGAVAFTRAFPDDDVGATAQAVPALMGKPFPIVPAGMPRELPSTGDSIWLLVLGAASVGAVLLMSGLALRKKRA